MASLGAWSILGASPAAAGEWSHSDIFDPTPRWGSSLRPPSPLPRVVVAAVGSAVIATGELHEVVHPGWAAGAQLAVDLKLAAAHALRPTVAWQHQRLGSAVEGLDGQLVSQHLEGRLDYLIGRSWWRPYLGLALGIAPYAGQVTERASGEAHLGHGLSPMTASGLVGIDLNLYSNLSLAPEAAFSYLGGGLRSSLWRLGLGLRWLV